MRIWGISDLHLAGDSNKSMDIFGANWRNHVNKMQKRWDRSVQPNDVVLCPGDLSWAMRLMQAQNDLQWISERPGLKILSRGNHDYWWSRIHAVRAVLPQGCIALQNDSCDVGSWVIAAARGWEQPEKQVTSETKKIYQRELIRMRLSLQHAREHFSCDKTLIAAMHYPPFTKTGRKTEFVKLLQEFDVQICVYGHLHGERSHRNAIEGVVEGIEYHLISCDWLQFQPKLIAW